MKVCYVVLNSIWYDPRVRKQIISYKEAGCELECVGLVNAKYNEQAVAKIPCPVHLARVNKKERHSRNIFTRFMTFIYLLKEIKQICELILKVNPDIIHANDLNALVPAYKASRKLGCKLIYDTHEICLENNTIHNNKLLKLFYGYYEKRIIRKVDAVICVSNAAADYLADFYQIPKPTVVTNCCISKEVVNSEEKKSGFEVLNHGQFYAGRGYDIMVEAAPLLTQYPEIRLAMRGFGIMEEQLRNRVIDLQVNNVIFYPKVKVEELIPYASHSMVGIAVTESICLNFELSVSNKLFEYAAAGLPVIMSNIPEHRYLNEKYHFGVVISDNTPHELAKAIIKLHTDKAFYHECKQNAIKMTNKIIWEKEFDKLLKIEKSWF